MSAITSIKRKAGSAKNRVGQALLSKSNKKILKKVKDEKAFEQNARKREADVAARKERLAKEAKLAAIEKKEQADLEWEEFKALFDGFDKDHVWVFNAGNYGRDFRGNPKYMFAYVSNYRKDIFAYWVSQSAELVEQVRALGFNAYLSKTPEAAYAAERTGVAVVEQVKGSIPFKDVKYVNLWHGMGFKTTERGKISDDDDMRLEIMPKYVRNNPIYLNQMLLAVTCPMQEEQFHSDFGLDSSRMLRTGYARCTYQKKYLPIVTYDHNIKEQKGLSDDVKIVVYAPTFRNARGNSFADAFPDLESLHESCVENNILMAFKMHPLMDQETGFITARDQFSEYSHFLFWDNQNDIYEIIDQTDLLIYDYSSIFSDFLCAGVKRYIRYIYDIEEEGSVTFESLDEYYERTAGTICHSFDELLEALKHSDEDCPEEVLNDIYQKQWAYAGEDDFEKTIQAVMDFRIKREEYPTLYSFDVFDTLISRKGLAPESIFYSVRERMIKAGDFPPGFVDGYPSLRISAENNAREYMRKSVDQRESFHVEIKMKQIFDHMKEVYSLTDDQAERLMQWEIEEEIDAVVPLDEQISLVKDLISKNETVVLISDMYLPKDVITKMLEKADPDLAGLPLFLSNEYGVLKTSRLLFFEVYRSFKPFYRFGKWYHYGDNINADQTQPRKVGITTWLVEKPVMSSIEIELARFIDNPDGFLTAAMQARLRHEISFAKADFVISFVAPIMVSYVDWAVRDALSKGFQTLYFVSRDGHPLKRIADALIETNGWNIKTKYIYASRRTWRIPSYFDEIDSDFWSNNGGNFNDIDSKEKLFRAMDIDDQEKFEELFPQINLDSIDFTNWVGGQPAKKLIPLFRASEEYRDYLLSKAAEERILPCAYLRQEIDSSEKFAFLEFWGRGYNQTCHSRLWNYVVGEEVPTYYYYSRSIMQSEGCCVRYNMTVDKTEVLFMESIFANMPYKSIESYVEENGRIEPVIEPVNYDEDLFNAMEQLLPEYARRYAALNLSDPETTDRKIYDFMLAYFMENKNSPFIYENVGSLVDAVAIYGRKKEYAHAYTMEDLDNFRHKIPRGRGTRSITMSYYRSTPDFRQLYDEYYQIEPGDDPAGGKILTESQLMSNRRNKEQFFEVKERALEAEEAYKAACAELRIKDLAVVLTQYKSPGGLAASRILKALDGDESLQVKVISVKGDKHSDGKIMRILAQARVVLVEGFIPQIIGLNFREGTSCIVLNVNPFKLYNEGKAFKHERKWAMRIEEQKYDIRFSSIEAGGPGKVSYLHASSGRTFAENNIIKGNCLTDVYFDEDFQKESRRLVEEAFPEIQGRKVIAYLFTPRNRSGRSQWLEMLELRHLSDLIGDKYYVIVDTLKGSELQKRYRNEINVPGFSSLNTSKDLNARMLLAAADIIIGDYRNVFFESVFLDKPVYSSAVDLFTLSRKANLAYNLLKIYPFPVLNSEEDLAQRLENTEQYDYAPLREFREEYFGWCDGHTAERIAEFILDQVHSQPAEEPEETENDEMEVTGDSFIQGD